MVTKIFNCWDRVSVDKVAAGWWEADYFGGAKLIQMWLMCKALNNGVKGKE